MNLTSASVACGIVCVAAAPVSTRAPWPGAPGWITTGLWAVVALAHAETTSQSAARRMTPGTNGLILPVFGNLSVPGILSYQEIGCGPCSTPCQRETPC